MAIAYRLSRLITFQDKKKIDNISVFPHEDIRLDCILKICRKLRLINNDEYEVRTWMIDS